MLEIWKILEAVPGHIVQLQDQSESVVHNELTERVRPLAKAEHRDNRDNGEDCDLCL